LKGWKKIFRGSGIGIGRSLRPEKKKKAETEHGIFPSRDPGEQQSNG
jgi:hypothetical protein